MSTLRALPDQIIGGQNALDLGVTEDNHPPLIMGQEQRELMATIIFEDVLAGKMGVILALKKLAYYDAYAFNTLRMNHPAMSPRFEGANFAGMVFNGFNFAGADFKGANLEGAAFLGCDLTGASFEGAVGTPGEMVDCTMEGNGAQDDLREVQDAAEFDGDFGQFLAPQQ